MSGLKPVITVTLEPAQAAALHRLCDKISYEDAKRYLYPHVPAGTREAQAYDMIHACSALQRALEDQGIAGWPWIESGHP